MWPGTVCRATIEKAVNYAGENHLLKLDLQVFSLLRCCCVECGSPDGSRDFRAEDDLRLLSQLSLHLFFSRVETHTRESGLISFQATNQSLLWRDVINISFLYVAFGSART